MTWSGSSPSPEHLQHVQHGLAICHLCARSHRLCNVGGSNSPRCEIARPSPEACGVLRQATLWSLERRSLLFRDAAVVPLVPLRQNRQSPWPLPSTSTRRATCPAFITQLHDCRRRCGRRRRCRTTRRGRRRLTSCARIENFARSCSPSQSTENACFHRPDTVQTPKRNPSSQHAQNVYAPRANSFHTTFTLPI